jgi:hypothetical protein
MKEEMRQCFYLAITAVDNVVAVLPVDVLGNVPSSIAVEVNGGARRPDQSLKI